MACSHTMQTELVNQCSRQKKLGFVLEYVREGFLPFSESQKCFVLCCLSVKQELACVECMQT